MGTGFSFSPKIPTYSNSTFFGYNYTYQDPAQGTSAHLLDRWLLCNAAQACTGLESLHFINGSTWRNCTYNYHVGSQFETNVTCNCTSAKHISYSPMPVCVRAPFLFIVFNASTINKSSSLSCESQNCLLSECWNATVGDSAVIARIPTYIPMLVQVNSDNLPVLLRHKRDFGITAAIIAAIAASATAATVAAVALTTSVQTEAALNNVTGMVAEALATQEQINGHLHAGILIVNQRVDLVLHLLVSGKKCYNNLFRSSNSGPDLVPWLFS